MIMVFCIILFAISATGAMISLGDSAIRGLRAYNRSVAVNLVARPRVQLRKSPEENFDAEGKIIVMYGSPHRIRKPVLATGFTPIFALRAAA